MNEEEVQKQLIKPIYKIVRRDYGGKREKEPCLLGFPDYFFLPRNPSVDCHPPSSIKIPKALDLDFYQAHCREALKKLILSPAIPIKNFYLVRKRPGNKRPKSTKRGRHKTVREITTRKQALEWCLEMYDYAFETFHRFFPNKPKTIYQIVESCIRTVRVLIRNQTHIIKADIAYQQELIRRISRGDEQAIAQCSVSGKMPPHSNAMLRKTGVALRPAQYLDTWDREDPEELRKQLKGQKAIQKARNRNWNMLEEALANYRVCMQAEVINFIRQSQECSVVESDIEAVLMFFAAYGTPQTIDEDSWMRTYADQAKVACDREQIKESDLLNILESLSNQQPPDDY